MKQEDKELLLKDLCARLPYGVKVLYENKVFNIDYISGIYEEIKLDIPDNYTIDIEDVKPYLFPISSMTEEQKRESPFESSLLNAFINGYISLFEDEELTIDDLNGLYDWFNKNHFDYRGLIPLGLANDATGLNIYSD